VLLPSKDVVVHREFICEKEGFFLSLQVISKVNILLKFLFFFQYASLKFDEFQYEKLTKAIEHFFYCPHSSIAHLIEEELLQSSNFVLFLHLSLEAVLE
jgi:hypothetical protein